MRTIPSGEDPLHSLVVLLHLRWVKTWLLDACLCPWTQGLHISKLSSSQGSRGFEIRVFLLLDRLPIRADKLYLPEATGFQVPVIRLLPTYAEATRRSKTVPPREGRGGLAVRGYNIAHAIGAFFRL